jgi:hypothetical protein
VRASALTFVHSPGPRPSAAVEYRSGWGFIDHHAELPGGRWSDCTRVADARTAERLAAYQPRCDDSLTPPGISHRRATLPGEALRMRVLLPGVHDAEVVALRIQHPGAVIEFLDHGTAQVAQPLHEAVTIFGDDVKMQLVLCH